MPQPSYPSGENALDGARLALQNADAHRASAELLASNGLHGIAASHLVLATEEAVKAFSFFLASIGLPLPEADARRLLTNHRARHALGLISQVVASFITRSVDIRSMFPGEEIPAPERLLDQVPVIFSGLQAYLSGPHDPEFTDDLHWWDGANSLKQSGMYVDYLSEDGWKSPSDLTEQEYFRSADVVNRFFEFFDRIFRSMLNTDEATIILHETLLRPAVDQLNSGRAEEIGRLFLGSDSRAEASD